MVTIVQLPVKFNLGALYRFTRDIVSPDGRPMDDVFIFDFEPLNFIDGTGYTVLSNTLQWLIYQNVQCRLLNYENLNRDAIIYLDGCGFFLQHLGSRLSYASELKNTTLPCKAVAHAQAHGWLEFNFSRSMCSWLMVSHGALGPIRTCIKELFHNISDHSTQNTGFVHAQHYPTAYRVNITVSDFGKGIPANICDRFGEMSDGSAILHASKEGVTSKSRPSNMGAGLSYLIDTVTMNSGEVRIYSSGGSLHCARGPDGATRRSMEGRGSYPGTLVDIALDTRLYVGDDEERGQVEWW